MVGEAGARGGASASFFITSQGDIWFTVQGGDFIGKLTIATLQGAMMLCLRYFPIPRGAIRRQGTMHRAPTGTMMLGIRHSPFLPFPGAIRQQGDFENRPYEVP